ncbi:hypothetical protein chiPu_0031414, partial [Chiloscyllium punctatum]|nr:hypothetical protein [Chiloscyllium punctatum]
MGRGLSQFTPAIAPFWQAAAVLPSTAGGNTVLRIGQSGDQDQRDAGDGQQGSGDDPRCDLDMLEHDSAHRHGHQRVDRSERCHQRDRAVADRGEQAERAEPVADPGQHEPEPPLARRLHQEAALADPLHRQHHQRGHDVADQASPERARPDGQPEL